MPEESQVSYPQYKKRLVLPVIKHLEAEGCALVEIDIYAVIDAFETRNPAQQHAIKKIIRAGTDHLSYAADMKEVKDSIDRAVELERLRALNESEASK